MHIFQLLLVLCSLPPHGVRPTSLEPRRHYLACSRSIALNVVIQSKHGRFRVGINLGKRSGGMLGIVNHVKLSL